MLAGAKSVDGEIRAGAEIVEEYRPAHGDPIDFAAGGFYLIVAVGMC